ncbi:unnamed protein product [Rotaria magnacalcarata]|uniref:F-box domain-containing protein n=1 Tax=Rotaria magnacalcarata TaxID=392030 RepID=A0A819LXK2_9BILA|nr:unnamed protein product [Rotaria magnacalcarata]CAF3969001.1 unnamed protein product [Rotaria magnacalcarata]
MNEHNVHLLALPNEILFLILKKLDNIDVLYSLLGINNQRLDIIAQQQIFSNILNFVSSSQSTDEHSSIPVSILDRFCVDILPRVHQNVISLIVEFGSLECILRVGNYPNLTELQLFNFNKAVISRCFMDDSLFGHIGQQIIHLILISNENDSSIISEAYTEHVYAIDNLPNLKCFSLICYNGTRLYRKQVLPLLRRMSYLEELTLYIHILDGPTFISGTHIDDEILRHMSRLHMFTFHMVCEKSIGNPTIRISKSDIERTFTNIKHRSVACMIDYFDCINMISRVFSLPFKFDRLEHIGNNIPDIQFNFVSYLTLWDPKPYKHKFFVRLTRAFPILRYLSIWNIEPPFFRRHESDLYDADWCSIVEFPHLISLEIDRVSTYYVEHFLNETTTHLPRLTKLKVDYKQLKLVTKNFTRDETRRNCAQVKQLIARYPMINTKDFCSYFPSLLV